MDAAEKWLQAADPDYERTSRAWIHVRETGEYRAPREEIPVGGLHEIALLVDAGARPVGNSSVASDRACERCTRLFSPWDAGQRFCGDLCRAAARRDYERDYKRAKRASRAA